MGRVLLAFLVLGALVGIVTERAVGNGGEATAETVSSPAPVAPSVSLGLSRASTVWGGRLVAVGRVHGAPPGRRVVVERLDGLGWLPLGVGVTGRDGRYRIGLLARAGGEIRARIEGKVVTTGSVPLAVAAKASGRVRRATAFVGARIVVRVRPWTYSGRASLVVVRRGREVGRAVATVRRGRLVGHVPLPGFGRYRVRVELPAADGIAGHTLVVPVQAHPEPVSVGSRGVAVRALTRRLIELGYRLPGETSDYGPQVFDAVLAFQKAAGLDRTGSMSEEDWRRLASAHTPRPRYRRPANHLEVDLTRQILLVVRAGKVTAVLPVSTGALGNTPEGKWRILRKDPWTTTWLGPAILYRTMTFWRNEVAVHGFPSVPAYPASHGCVRVPMWAADWLYRRTPVGQRIYVYSS